MSSSRDKALTRAELIEYIKRQLGYPTRNVELTDDQLEDAIDFALEEIQPRFNSKYYITIQLNNRSAIHLPSEFEDNREIADVSDCIKIPSEVPTESSSSSDPFNGNYIMRGVGIAGMSSYHSKFTNNNIHQIIGNYARLRNQAFYDKLTQILYQRTMGSLQPSINFDFHEDDQTLYIGVGYPPSSIITIEYTPVLNDPKFLTDKQYIRVAKDLAVGQALILQSRITGKFNIDNAPTRINYEAMRDEGNELITEARRRLTEVIKPASVVIE